ncbi:glycosyltransferase involved in cell wall biosynthesis [Actinoplanes lutulentus]|uniref:Glycosyl transferase family 2 n=1 Tax=Actinoplanes lutulentus TaxID=1287878 RepID=A0A327YWZ3_9ACTN|nr:glycosyltransferase family 2 protein [Actinoplanes lutulentus]MBB2943420.1 glycosyltransferase involved in cell wall biosynthesis [Actinoplanes lutulentus]RAK26061.1 glycosyl transferase family 2 [Actinoplanes lutulentus]
MAELRVSVVVCTYSMSRWESLRASVASVEALSPFEIIVVVDHCPELADRCHRSFSVMVLESSEPPGLSGARNAGVRACAGDVVAFVDDDAVVDRQWLSLLIRSYSDESVSGVGGCVEPMWNGGRPAWFPPEFDWVVGCSHSGMPRELAAVRNLIGTNMSFRTSVLRESGGFRTSLGRRGDRLLFGEETELCIRIGGTLLYDPRARVRHHVPVARQTVRYFVTRCFGEGLSKARITRLVGAGRGLADERAHVRRTLPRALARATPARFAAILGGLAVTALGYAAGLASRR